MKNQNLENIFSALENNAAFKADLDLIKASIELSAPVVASDNIASEKARLTMINRVNRVKRLKKFQSLHDSALSLIVSNTDSEDIESLAIYASDKLIQTARFMTGEREIFGRGKNNTLMYAIRGLYVHKPIVASTAFVRGQLERYGQPSSSSATQASSSCKALQALKIASPAGRGLYKIDYNNVILKALFESLERA